VDELLIAARVRELEAVGVIGRSAATAQAMMSEPAVTPSAAGEAAEARWETVRLADELITRATQTAAKITFVEDPELLANYGGVAATLRFTT
jgi:peptide subunit release factor 1 (eRF1)